MLQATNDRVARDNETRFGKIDGIELGLNWEDRHSVFGKGHTSAPFRLRMVL